MCKSLDRRREDKGFYTEWWHATSEFNLLLIYSWMEFWLATVVATDMNNLLALI